MSVSSEDMVPRFKPNLPTQDYTVGLFLNKSSPVGILFFFSIHNPDIVQYPSNGTPKNEFAFHLSNLRTPLLADRYLYTENMRNIAERVTIFGLRPQQSNSFCTSCTPTISNFHIFVNTTSSGKSFCLQYFETMHFQKMQKKRN